MHWNRKLTFPLICARRTIRQMCNHYIIETLTLILFLEHRGNCRKWQSGHSKWLCSVELNCDNVWIIFNFQPCSVRHLNMNKKFQRLFIQHSVAKEIHYDLKSMACWRFDVNLRIDFPMILVSVVKMLVIFISLIYTKNFWCRIIDRKKI